MRAPTNGDWPECNATYLLNFEHKGRTYQSIVHAYWAQKAALRSEKAMEPWVVKNATTRAEYGTNLAMMKGQTLSVSYSEWQAIRHRVMREVIESAFPENITNARVRTLLMSGAYELFWENGSHYAREFNDEENVYGHALCARRAFLYRKFPFWMLDFADVGRDDAEKAEAELEAKALIARQVEKDLKSPEKYKQAADRYITPVTLEPSMMTGTSISGVTTTSSISVNITGTTNLTGVVVEGLRRQLHDLGQRTVTGRAVPLPPAAEPPANGWPWATTTARTGVNLPRAEVIEPGVAQAAEVPAGARMQGNTAAVPAFPTGRRALIPHWHCWSAPEHAQDRDIWFNPGTGVTQVRMGNVWAPFRVQPPATEMEAWPLPFLPPMYPHEGSVYMNSNRLMQFRGGVWEDTGFRNDETGANAPPNPLRINLEDQVQEMRNGVYVATMGPWTGGVTPVPGGAPLVDPEPAWADPPQRELREEGGVREAPEVEMEEIVMRLDADTANILRQVQEIRQSLADQVPAPVVPPVNPEPEDQP